MHLHRRLLAALVILLGGLYEFWRTGRVTALASIGRLFITARSRIADDALSRAVERGVRQIVILGAGLDTFALRNPPWRTTDSFVEFGDLQMIRRRGTSLSL